MSVVNFGLIAPVTSIAGTVGQILVNGQYGAVNGPVTLSLDVSSGASGVNDSINGLTGSITIGGVNGNLISISGQTIWVSGTSGYNAAVYSTIANLQGQGANLSGNLTLTGQTLLTTIAATGQQAWTTANNNGLNSSGALVAASGALVTQIQSAAGVLSLNGATGLLTLTAAPSPAGYIGVSLSGTTLYISGVSAANGALALATHTTSGGGLGLGPDNSIWRTGPNTIQSNSTVTANGLISLNNVQLGGNSNLYFGNNAKWVSPDLITLAAFNNAGTLNANLIAGTGILVGGAFLGVTGNYTPSGAASVAQLFALSGFDASALTTLSGWLTNAGTSNVVYTTGAQTVTAVKTFTTGIVIGSAPISVQPSLFQVQQNGQKGVFFTTTGTPVDVVVFNNGQGLNAYGSRLSFAASAANTPNAYIAGGWGNSTNDGKVGVFTSADGGVTYTQAATFTSGRVGIGTANPTAALEVVGNQFFHGGALNVDQIQGYTNGRVTLGGGAVATELFSNGAQAIALTNGNVGIGLTNPTSTFVVSGTSLFTNVMVLGSGLVMGTSDVTGGGLNLGPGITLFRAGNNVARLNTNSSTMVEVGANYVQIGGGVGATATLQSQDGSAATPALRFVNAGGNGLWYPGSTGLAIAVNAANALSWDVNRVATFSSGIILGNSNVTGGGVAFGPTINLFTSSSGVLALNGTAPTLAFQDAGTQRAFIQTVNQSLNVAAQNGLTFQTNANVTAQSLSISGDALFARNVSAASGLFFADTGNYTRSGAASVAQLIGLSGSLANPTTPNIVYTTGDQAITGIKTFATNIVVSNTINTANKTLGAFLGTSVNWSNGTLIDYNTSNASVDWISNRSLSDSSSALSVAWNSRTLVDVNGATSVNWANRSLIDTSGNVAFFWVPSGVTSNSGIYLKDTGNYARNSVASVAQLIGLSGADSTTYATIVNLAQTGATIETQLTSLSGWAAPATAGYVYTTGAQTIAGAKTFSNNAVFNSSLVVNGLFSTSSKTLSLPGLGTTIDWNAGVLNDSTFNNGPSINWTNRLLYDAIGAVSIDWTNRIMNDASVVQSTDWNRRSLIDSVGNPQLYWNMSGISTPSSIYLGNTGNYTRSGVASVAQLFALSGAVTTNVVMTNNTTATATFNSGVSDETIYDDSVSLVSSLTINLPSVSRSGQLLRYLSKAGGTIVTVNGNVSVGAAITTLAANSSVAWQSTNTTGIFIRLQ